MFPAILNPLPVMISFSAMFGVVIHDTQIYKATSLAALPISSISTQAPNLEILKTSDHIHVASASFANPNSVQEVSIQPRNENDKKYVFNRRTLGNNFDSDYVWPSV